MIRVKSENEASIRYESDDMEKDISNLKQEKFLSAATELCLMYLHCDKLIKKHEAALGKDID